ncbi:MAG: tetratricopeptide repeat protein [Saprospiraceae bacterium]|nr:tetratricopeptide repeat protein [Saprospiraceae bacterium]
MRNHLLFTFFLLFSISLYAQYSHLKDLKFGSYPVGFQVFNRFDYGRHTQPKLDFEGKLYEGESALPMQIAVWYPAQIDNNAPKLLFEEYAYLTKQVNYYKPLTEQDKQEAREIIRGPAKGGANIELSDADIQAIAKTSTAAVKDAKPQAGTFPLIICGYQGGPSFNNILCEYLASLGYVVVATSSISKVGSWQATKPPLAIQESINNLEYLLNFAQSLSNVNTKQLGVIGTNFEGMPALLFQMKQMQADAVVSIDGWEGKQGSVPTILESIHFDVNKMRVPYFAIMQDEQNPSPYLTLSQAIPDTLVYSQSYYYVLKEMNHSYLIANLSIIPSISPEKSSAYSYLYTSIGHFLDAFVKKSPTSIRFMQQTATENGFPQAIIKTAIKKNALPAVPIPDEFEALVMNGDIEKVTNIYKAAKKSNPNVSLFDFNTIRLFAFRFNQRKQYDKVLAIWKLGAEAFPESVRVMENLGDTYQNLNNSIMAKQSYEKALQLLVNNAAWSEQDKNVMRAALLEKIKKVEGK